MASEKYGPMVGENHGYISLNYGKHPSEILTLNPNPKCYDKLQEQIFNTISIQTQRYEQNTA